MLQQLSCSWSACSYPPQSPPITVWELLSSQTYSWAQGHMGMGREMQRCCVEGLGNPFNRKTKQGVSSGLFPVWRQFLLSLFASRGTVITGLWRWCFACSNYKIQDDLSFHSPSDHLISRFPSFTSFCLERSQRRWRGDAVIWPMSAELNAPFLIPPQIHREFLIESNTFFYAKKNITQQYLGIFKWQRWNVLVHPSLPSVSHLTVAQLDSGLLSEEVKFSKKYIFL